MKRQCMLLFAVIVSLVILRYELVNAEGPPPVTREEEGLPWASRKECMKKFGLDSVDLTNEQWDKDNSSLSGYFACRAIATGDIDECEGIVDQHLRKGCRERAKIFSFWTRLMKGEFVLVDECEDVTSLSRRECEDIIEGFKVRNTSVCRGRKGCIAIVTLDEELADDPVTKQIVIFRKAIENSNIAECHNLPKENSEGSIEACKALVTGNLSFCETCRGIEVFRDHYCEWLDQYLKEKTRESNKRK